MANNVLGFKIWYSTTQVSGENYDDWLHSPDGDVQIVMLYFKDPDGGVPLRQIALGNDFYALTESVELTHGDDEAALSGHVKRGAWTSAARIGQLQAEAAGDTGEGWLWKPAAINQPSRGGA